eukprot:656343-Pleurochrysis_carterae.AAC.2
MNTEGGQSRSKKLLLFDVASCDWCLERSSGMAQQCAMKHAPHSIAASSDIAAQRATDFGNTRFYSAATLASAAVVLPPARAWP